MSRFRKKEKKEVPEINTGSMSDIIFMFLFFFMVITTMRESDAKVTFDPPRATEYQKLDKKFPNSAIFMGAPLASDAPAIDGAVSVQLNDKFCRVPFEQFNEDIKGFILEERDACAKQKKDPGTITYFLKIDNNVKMRYVTRLKEELRRNNALKINYATGKEERKK